MKIWDKFKEKLIKAQLGLSVMKMAVDLRKAQNLEVLFPSEPKVVTKNYTIQHLGAFIPVGILMVVGFWFKWVGILAFISYVAYNVSQYRGIDSNGN